MRNATTTSAADRRCSTALLLVDVINDMVFEGSDALVRHAEPMAERLRDLKRRAREASIPAIYINDNFGKWRSDFRSLVDHCVKDDVPGRNVARILQPDADDYFVLKPKHSAFYGTTLDILLKDLGTTTVILTGIAGNICILFSANDAHMRDLRLFIPADCVASNTAAENVHALELMERVVRADITESVHLDLDRIVHEASANWVRV